MPFEELRDQLEVALSRDDGARNARLVAPLEPIVAGWASTRLFTSRLSYSDSASTDVVVKVYDADAGGAAHAAREAAALEHLRVGGLQVPAVLFVEPGPGAISRPVVVMERVAGRSLWSRYEEADHASRAALTTAFTEQLVRFAQSPSATAERPRRSR